MATERRYGGEVRAEGRRLVGRAMVYGEVSPSHRERFDAGAFDVADGRTRWLDLGHDRAAVLAHTANGGLILNDTAAALEVLAELPEIPAADIALERVRAGDLRGFSVEFDCVEESLENGIRVVRRADLAGIGLVRSPSYPSAGAEAREAGGWSFLETRARGFRGYRIPFRKKLSCGCHRGECDTIAIENARVSDSALLVAGSYAKAVASVKRGSLRVRMSDDGIDLDVDDLAATTFGREVIEQAAVVPLVIRPIFTDASDYSEAGGVATYRLMEIRGFVIGSTDADGGWQPLELNPGGRSARRPDPRLRGYI